MMIHYCDRCDAKCTQKTAAWHGKAPRKVVLCNLCNTKAGSQAIALRKLLGGK